MAGPRPFDKSRREGAVLFGFHAVLARVRIDPESITELLVAAGRHDARMQDLLDRAASAGVAHRSVPAEHLDRVAGTHHQGVVAFVSRAPSRVVLDDVLGAAEAAGDPPLLLVLDEVQDPHNLGACLRNADALGAHAVVVPKDRAAGLTPAVVKVASGAAETVPLVTVTNLARTLDDLKARGIWVYGADADGEVALFDADLRGPLAWVLGAEGRGLRRLTRETCDARVRIPRFGTVASLNVSVAAGICLYETRRARQRASR
jgi:23S rRNA (guanosine2251-2'-O)-methyltransferase